MESGKEVPAAPVLSIESGLGATYSVKEKKTDVFQVGDKVMLNSGSPELTIKYLFTEQENEELTPNALVEWEYKNGKIVGKTFPIACLCPYQELSSKASS